MRHSPTSAGVQVRRLSYGFSPHHVGELRQAESSRGIVMILHGGFWRSHRTLDMTAPMAEALTLRGFDTWNVEYRRGSRGTWSETLSDVAAAFDHIEALADEYSLNTEDRVPPRCHPSPSPRSRTGHSGRGTRPRRRGQGRDRRGRGRRIPRRGTGGRARAIRRGGPRPARSHERSHVLRAQRQGRTSPVWTIRPLYPSGSTSRRRHFPHRGPREPHGLHHGGTHRLRTRRPRTGRARVDGPTARG